MHLNGLLEQGVVALTASRRLAHAMRLRYAQYAQAQGHAVWRTPQVLPWSAWLRQQRLAMRAASAADTERLLTPAQARVLWDDIVAGSRAGRALLTPSNAARLAARSWQRLHDYLIPLERLEDFDTPEAQALLAWGRAFEQRCAALGAIDDARLAQRLHESRFVPQERIVLAGFDRLVPAMARLVSHWRDGGRVVDADETAPQASWIRVISGADAEAEIELAAQWSRSQVERGARSIGVILPDLQARREEVRRVFEDVFAPGQRHTQAPSAAIPVAIAAPPPLATYALIDAALLVLRIALGTSDAAAIGRLLRSPFIVAGVSERAARALADQRLREKQRDRWDWFELERWASVQHCDQLALAAREVSAALRGAPRQSSPSEWAERFHGLLARMGWPGERTLTSVEHQALAKFQDALAEFGGLDTVAPRLSAAQALHRFQELLRDTPFEPESPHASVIVIDATTSAGMQFDALWVAGLQAERLPAPINPDPLIPLQLQREAGMPEATAAGLLQTARAQVDRWSRSAPQVAFSWPAREGDAELSVSPLLSQFELAAAPARSTPTLRETLFAQRPELERVNDERAPAVEGSTLGGAAILELQSRCPFKAHAQLRLKAEPLAQIGVGVDPAERGGLVHEVLHEIWASLGSQQALLQMPEPQLEARVRDAAQRHAMRLLNPDTRVRERLTSLEVAATVQRVMQLLAIERQRPAFKVRFAEASERYTIGGLGVTLRPDRIDELDEGGEVLIDYKLGEAHRPSHWLDRTPGRPKSPQLPLYGLAHGERLRALAFVVLANGKVEYRGWSDGAYVAPGIDAYPPKRLRVDLGDPMDWQALQHQWQFVLSRLAERFLAGEAAVDPLHGECDYCHLSTLCRIHEIVRPESAERDDE